jgi:hypothetical protein
VRCLLPGGVEGGGTAGGGAQAQPTLRFSPPPQGGGGGGMARLRLPRLPFVHSNAGDAAIQEELRCSDERQERAVRKRTDHPHRPLGSRVQ